ITAPVRRSRRCKGCSRRSSRSRGASSQESVLSANKEQRTETYCSLFFVLCSLRLARGIMPGMTPNHMMPTPLHRIATPCAQHELEAQREAPTRPRVGPHGAPWWAALDEPGLLTKIIPELEPARATDQPNVHFLPVLAHSIEAVAAVDWLMDQLEIITDQA